MTAVARMAVLDLRSIGPYRRQSLLLIAVAAVMGIAAEPPGGVLPMIAFYAVFVASYPFAVAEKDDLDTLYSVLPLTRRAVLLGRYAGAVATFLVAGLTGTVLTLLVGGLKAVPVTGSGLAVPLAVSWGTFALVVSIQFPLFLRLGYARARLLANLPFMVLIAAVAALGSRLHLGGEPASAWLGLVVVAGILAVSASCLISIRIDPRRDRRRTVG